MLKWKRFCAFLTLLQSFCKTTSNKLSLSKLTNYSPLHSNSHFRNYCWKISKCFQNVNSSLQTEKFQDSIDLSWLSEIWTIHLYHHKRWLGKLWVHWLIQRLLLVVFLLDEGLLTFIIKLYWSWRSFTGCWPRGNFVHPNKFLIVNLFYFLFDFVFIVSF